VKNLREFFRLDGSERRFLLRIGLLLWATRLGLWLLPLPTLRRLLSILLPSKRIAETGSTTIEKIIWAVRVSTRYVPVATCLTQALVTQALLVQHGEPAVLQIGVAKDPSGNLIAHAWVENRGCIVIGDSRELFRYTRLPSLEGKLL